MSSAQGQKLTVFRPPQISGLVAWFDASDPSSVQGNPVTQWNDKSSNGNSAVATTGPTYTSDPQGRPCMSFTGTQWLESLVTVPGTSHSLIAVHAPTYTNGSNGAGGTYGGNSSLFRFQTGANYLVFPYYANGPRGYITSYGLGSGDATLVENSVAGTASIINANIAPTSQIIYKNGTQQSSQATSLTSGTSPALTIGRYTPGLLEYYQGYVYEMIVYSASLTQTQRQNIEGYLGWKWGLQASLSNAHPYLTVNPETPVYPLYPFTVPNLGTATPIFTPRQVPGCAVWFDGADQSSMTFSSSSNISLWRDKSGNAYNAIASGSPGLIGFNTVSPSGVYFNGTTAYLSNFACPINLSRRAIFIVMQEVTHTDFTGILSFIPNPTTGSDYQTPTGMSIETKFGLRFYANSGTYLSDMGNTTLLQKSIYFDSMNGTQGGSFFNGANTSNNVANSTQEMCTGFVLGARWNNGVSTYTNSIIHEIILYSNAITAVQRQAVEGYLATKWSTIPLLASSNPYTSGSKLSYGLAAAVPLPITRAAGAVNWRPTQLGQCQLWLDAADASSIALTSGNVVSTWSDKSGLGNNASQVNGPTYVASQKGILFNGASSQYFTLPNGTFPTGNSSYSYFMIVNFNDLGPNWSGVLGGGGYGATTADTIAFRTNGVGGGFVHYWWGNDLGSSTTFNVNQTVSVEGQYISGGTRNITQNFTIVTTDTPGTHAQSAGNNTIGRSYSVGNEYMKGYIYEVICYSNALNSAQQAQVQGYLAWKWKLVGNLPAGHPYKLFPPAP
jgi:hypothetical protein